jgi:hypothetical protein
MFTSPRSIHTSLIVVAAGLLIGLPARAASSPTRQELPGPDQLPSVKELPDPFKMNDGSRVKTKEDWQRRRAELRELVLGYEYGRMPPAPAAGSVKASAHPWKPEGKQQQASADAWTNAAALLPPGTKHEELLLTVGEGGKIATQLILTVPPAQGGKNLPVIVCGDLCWGRVEPAIAAEAARRGYIIAEFDRTMIAPDNNDRSVGVYPAYPDYDWRALSAWAWGYGRVIDYLLTRDDVDAAHIAVTGHSRGGKATLVAGATDERIALTNPNNSGCGGNGCYRFQAPNSEDIARITKSFPFWFSPRFPEFIGKVDRLPFDQHSVKALVAPRAFLSTEALGDLWANPEGTQKTHLAAKEVWDFLGAPDRIGIYYREGKHEHNLGDWTVLLDFADKVFFQKDVKTRFDKLAYPVDEKAFTWKAPGKA